MWARSSAALLAAAALVGQEKPAPPRRGPIALYETACVRCHGPNGSFYGPELGKGMTDAQLKAAIQAMCDNQGQVEDATPEDVEAQTAYHRAIIRKDPFVAITAKRLRELVGEATDGAQVSVTVDGRPVPVVRSGFVWRCRLPGPGPIVVTATLGKRVTRLDPEKSRHSHAVPDR